MDLNMCFVGFFFSFCIRYVVLICCCRLVNGVFLEEFVVGIFVVVSREIISWGEGLLYNVFMLFYLFVEEVGFVLVISCVISVC